MLSHSLHKSPIRNVSSSTSHKKNTGLCNWLILDFMAQPFRNQLWWKYISMLTLSRQEFFIKWSVIRPLFTFFYLKIHFSCLKFNLIKTFYVSYYYEHANFSLREVWSLGHFYVIERLRDSNKSFRPAGQITTLA